MAADTLIEWARHPVTGKGATWNIVTGCQIVSPGCTNCYAMKLAGTRLRDIPSRKGLTVPTKAGPVWNGQVRFNEEWLTQPLKWKTGRGIFVAAHGDLFADGVTDAQLDRIFAVMALTPQHIYFVLTKRPERMREYLATPLRVHSIAAQLVELDPGPSPGTFPRLPIPNVWLGVSVEDQPRADERIPILLDTPAAIRFISYEPALGPVDWSRWIAAGRKTYRPGGEPFIAPHWYMMKCEKCGWVGSSEKTICINYDDDADMACPACNQIICGEDRPQLDWIIAGGESGSNARPSHPDWFRLLRDQCASADVAFFFKQWGTWAPNIGAVDGWDLGDDPEISRFDHREWEDGRWSDVFRPMWCDFSDGNYDEAHCVSKIGKKRAGRMLDGKLHDAFPEMRP